MKRRLFKLGLLIALASARPASAQTNYTWTAGGGAGNWNTPGNWAPGTLFPSISGDTALFNFLNGAGAVDLNAPVTVGGLTFNNLSATPGQSYTIGGTGTINFANQGGGYGIALLGGAATGGTQTISAGLSFLTPTAVFTINNNAAPGLNTLTISGAITGTTSLTQLVAAGSSDTTITSVLAAGAIQNLLKTGLGTLTLGGANTFTGGLTLAQGTILVGNSTALGAATNPVTLGDATTGANSITLLLNPAGTTVAAAQNITAGPGTGGVTLGVSSPSLTGVSTLSGRISLNRPTAIVNAVAGERLDFVTGVIGGPVGLLTITGGSTVSFSNATRHQFAGDVAVTGTGTNLQLIQNFTLPFTASVNLAAGTTLDVRGTAAATNVTNAVAGLTGSGTLTSSQAPANTLMIGLGGGNATFSGSILAGAGNVGLTKIGTGTQTLAGNDNSTMGATSVFQGTLALDYATNVNAKIGMTSGLAFGGGTLQLSGGAFAQTTGTVTTNSGASSVTLPSGAVSLGLATTAGNTFARSAGGAVDFTNLGTGAITVGIPGAPNILLGGSATIGKTDWAILDATKKVVTLPAASYQTVNNVANWATTTPDPLFGLNFTNTAAYTGVLTASPANVANVRVNAAGNSSIDLGGNTLTLLSGGLMVTAAGGTTTVGNGTLVGAASVNALSITSASELTVHNYSVNTLTISAVIANNAADTTALNKVGSGKLVLTGANTYTGGTHINGGVLEVDTLASGGNPSPIGASPLGAANLQFNGGTLRYTAVGATTSIDRQFTINYGGATIDVVDAGTTLAFTSGGTVGFGFAGTAPYPGPTGGLTKTGAGTLILSGTTANTFSGITTVAQGTLVIGPGFGGDAALRGSAVINGGATLRFQVNNPFANTAMVTINAGGTLDFNSLADAVGGFQGSGSIINLGSTAATLITIDSALANAVFTGNITGPGGFSLRASPTAAVPGPFAFYAQTFSGPKSYTGPTSISAGILAIDLLANGGLPSSVGASSSLPSNLVLAGGTLRYIGGTTTTDRGLASNAAASTLDIGTANVTFTGAFSASANTNVLVKQGAGTLTLGGTGSNTVATGAAFIGLNLRVLEGTVVLGKDTTPLTFLSVPVNGAGGLQIFGGATVRLAGTGDNQLYSGAVAGSQGVYQIFSGGTLDLNGRGAKLDSLSGAGAITNTAAATSVVLTVGTGGASSVFPGTISDGAGTVSLVRGGAAGTTTLSGANTFTGPVSVFGGGLGLDYTTNFAAKIPAGQTLTMSGGTLTITGSPAGSTTTASIKGLTLTAGPNTVSNSVAATNTLLDFTAGGGTFTRGLGASLQFNLGGAGIKFPGTPSAALGGWATATSAGVTTFAGLDAANLVVPVATVNKNDLSTWVNGDNIVSSAAFTNNLPAGTTAVTGVTFNFAGVSTADLGAANTLGVARGVLVTSVVAANAANINNGTITGPVGGGDLVFNLQNLVTGITTVNSVIANNGAGVVNVVKYGPGRLALTGTNTYSGSTVVGAGILDVSNNAAFGGSPLVTLNAASGAVNLNLSNNVVIPASVTLAMTTNTPNNFVSDLRATLATAAGTYIWNGPITLNGGGLLSISPSGALTLNGPISGAPTGSVLLRGTGNAVLNGTMNLGASAVILKTDANQWTLNTAGNSWGTMQMASTGILKIGANDVLPTASLLLFGQVNATSTATLDLGGFNQTVANINVVAGGTSTGSSIGNSGTTADSTFTVAGPGASLYNGILKDVVGTGTRKLNLAVTGGTLTLTGANTFTGTTVVSAGTLTAGSANLGAGTTPIVLGGAATQGTLSYVGGANTFERGFTVNAGGGQLVNASGVLLSIATAAAATAGTFTLDGAANNDITVTSAIGGAGGLAKTGANTLTLAGNNGYTGATTVSAGKLYLFGTNSTASIGVAAGTTLGGIGSASAATATVAATGIVEAGFNGAGRLSLAGLTFAGAGTINIGTLINYSAAASVQVTGAGLLNPTGGANSVTINIANPGGAVIGSTYRLVGYAGTIGGSGFGAFQLAPLPSRGAGTLVNAAGSINLTITNIDTLIWTGAAAAANGWNTSTQNWKLSSNNSPTAFISSPGDSVIFDDGGAPNLSVGINTANVTPSSVLFNNSVDYVLQGTFGIAGATGVTLGGAGTVSLNNANSFTGGIKINSGVLKVGNAGALNATVPNAVTFGPNAPAGTKLQLNGFSVAIGALSTDVLPGSPVVESGSTVVGTDVLTVNSNVPSTFAGVIQDGGVRLLALTKAGGGVLTLAGANTYTGATNINGGAIVLPATGSISTVSLINVGGGTASGTLNIAGGSATTTVSNVRALNVGALTSGTFIMSGGSLSLSGAASGIVLADAVGLSAQFTHSGGTITVAGNGGFFTGNFGVSRLDLTGGTFSIANSTLNLGQRADTLINISGTEVFTVGNVISGGSLASNNTINLGDGVNFAGGASIVDGGTSGVFSAGTFTRTLGTNTLNFNGGTLIARAPSATYMASGFATVNVLGGGGVIDNNNLAITFLPAFLHGGPAPIDGGMVFKGSSATTLAGINTYTGPTVIMAGSLALSGTASLASNRIVIGDTVANGGSANLNVVGLTGGANFSAGSFRVVSGQTLAGHGTVVGLPVLIGAGATVAPGNSAGTLTIAADASLAGGTYAWELATAGTPSTVLGGSSPALPHTNHDVLLVTGAINVAGATVTITGLPGNGFVSTSSYRWLIGNSTGALTGTPLIGTITGSGVAGLPNGSFTLVTDTNNLYLNYSPVPEPAFMLLACGAMIGLVAFRRGKSRLA